MMDKKGASFIVWIVVALVGVWGVYNFLPEQVPTVEDTLMSAVSYGIKTIGSIGNLNLTNESDELKSQREIIYIESPYDENEQCRCRC